MDNLEKRYIPNGDLRVDFSGTNPRFVGYAATFNSPSEILSERHGGKVRTFREVLRSGCFADVLKSNELDVRALINHNADLILGRNKSGDLRLMEDHRGLRFEVDIDSELSYARDLKRNIEKGRISGCSFCYGVKSDGENWRSEGGLAFHDVHRVSQLTDVSIVTYPAYTSTEVSVRCLQALEDFEIAGHIGDEHYRRWLEIAELVEGH